MSADCTDVWEWRARLLQELPVFPGASRPGGPADEVSLLDARGRRLSDRVTAPEDMPDVAISAMDGFAVHSADLDPECAVELPVVADLPATSRSQADAAAPLRAGTVARIMTGAQIPSGADAVVEVEWTDASPFGAAPATVRLGPVPELRAGRHVRVAGEEVKRGAVLAEPGDRVGPGLLALAATLGLSALPVQRQFRVSVLVTGDEVVGGGQASLLAPGAVRDSNGIMLAAALADLGATARTLRSGDEPKEFLRALDAAAAGADLVITTGGIGHGAYDVVKSALGPDGRGTSHFAHLALRPGGPQGYGRAAGDVPVVHLPGTPVGALVGFHLFVRPMLMARADGIIRARLTAVPQEIGSRGDRRGSPRRPGVLALPGTLGGAAGDRSVEVLPGRRLAPFARADAILLLDMALDVEPPVGEEVAVIALVAGSEVSII